MLLRFISLLFFLVSILGTIALPLVNEDEDTNCGYQSCHPVKEGFINVHIISHTHDDVGWLKTVDQYYYGARSNIQKAGVQYILDTVIDALRKDENRRFIYVETGFFWKWWVEQNEEVQELTRNLVNNGRLEFISGGWSMNDEASTHYHSIVDQMTWGLRKLNDSFGSCGRPKIGWQIDPFGHSRGMASILAMLGFDGYLLNRIDWQDMQLRKDTNTLEMVWRASPNLGEKTTIFTGVLPKHYNAAPGFCFDILCNDIPMIDDRSIPDYNIDDRVTEFLNFLEGIYVGYATKNIVITMGGDFQYQAAEPWFKNTDKLIRYTNERQANGSQFNLIYSTPSCYIKAVYDESKGNLNWTVKHDDFMPHANDAHSYWTGYYTSRPTLKRYERESNNFLQICKQLSALTGVDSENIDWLREAMGVLQHHDAITGTEKQHVADDYARLLSEGIDSCQDVVSSALNKISTQQEDVKFVQCPFLNVSQCAFSENNDNFVVTVYNPLSRPVTKYVRVPVLGSNYSVVDSNGEKVFIQIQPIPQAVQNIPGRQSDASNELLFAARNIPPLGYESFFVVNTPGDEEIKPEPKDYDGAFVEIDYDTGLVSRLRTGSILLPMSQKFAYYNGFHGTNGNAAERSSGAYVFRPTSNVSTSVADSAEYEIYVGVVAMEIHQVFNEWVSQVLRVYNDENHVEVQWLVGPIPDDGDNGKEVITVYSTNLNTNSVFYTDSNGREVLKRVRNFRPTYDFNNEEDISGNYFPVTSKILIRDEAENREFAVLVDRAEGGSSINDGEVELMIHRRCLHDDAFGVGESLKEEAYGSNLVVRGTHYLVVGPIESTEEPTAAALQRDIAQRKLLDSWIFFSSTEDKTLEEYSASHKLKSEGLTRALPDNVQILTLEPWKESTFLLRLEHVFEANEDEEFSWPVSVDLNGLFGSFDIVSIKETTLGGNQWLEDNDRLVFDEEDSTEQMGETRGHKNHIGDDIDNLVIDLNPMEIRTFVIGIQLSHK